MQHNNLQNDTTSLDAPDMKNAYFGESKIVKSADDFEDIGWTTQSVVQSKEETAYFKPLPNVANDIFPTEKYSSKERACNNLGFSPPKSHSIILQKWTGYVASILDDEFKCVMKDVNSEAPEIIATFSVYDVPEGDRSLVEKDALCDWIIARERKIHGQIKTLDEIIFKRFPVWKRDIIENSSAKVDAYNEWISSEGKNPQL